MASVSEEEFESGDGTASSSETTSIESVTTTLISSSARYWKEFS